MDYKENSITKVRTTSLMITTVNSIVCGGDVFYFFDVVDGVRLWTMMQQVSKVKVNDFDYYPVWIVCDDDDDFYDDDDGDVYEISSSSSFSYVSLWMMMKVQILHRSDSTEKTVLRVTGPVIQVIFQCVSFLQVVVEVQMMNHYRHYPHRHHHFRLHHCDCMNSKSMQVH
jgi:hypothetical protein